MNYLVLFAILLAILPYLIFFIIYTRSSLRAWLAFIIGGLLWFVAALLRTPILQAILYLPFYPQPPQNIPPAALNSLIYSPWYLAISSAMAGIFEESFRFLGVTKIKFNSRNSKQIMSFGIGWGIGEAIEVYVIAMIPYLSANISDPIILIGAIERLIAITFHTSMAFFIYKCVKDKNDLYLIGAILIHFAYDYISVLIIYYVSLILGEIVVAIMTIILVYYLSRDYKKNPPTYQEEPKESAKE